MSFTTTVLETLHLAERRPAPDLSERGDSGVSYAAAGQNVASLIDPEYRYELRGIQGGRTYQRMRWSDPHIWGLREAQNLPMLQARATVEPADPDDSDAVVKAEFVQRVLIDDYPWRSFLRDSFLDMDYGFAAFEIVWRREGSEIRCRLALRPSSSISPGDVYVRDGVIDHVVQRTSYAPECTIPGEKLVWFAHCKEGDLFTGRPILRPMHKPWKIKEELEIELPIAVRKLGGVPDITTTGTPTKAEADDIDAAAKLFGLASDSFLRHTDKMSVQLLSGNVTVSDILEAIAQRNTELTSVCNAQVFDLGTSNSGSRALGSTLSDLFNNGITAHARRREDVLNASGGLIHQIIAYNFPRDDNRPALHFGSVQQVDLKSFAQALLTYSQAALPPDLDEWARREMNMPEGSVAQVQVPNAQGAPEGSGDGAELPEDMGAKAAEHAHTHKGLRLAEHREPRGVERYVALAEVDARFTDAKSAVREATQATRDKLIAEVVRRATDAQEKGQLAKFIAGAAPMVDALAGEIEDVLTDYLEAGGVQVADELDRQERGEPYPEERQAASTGEAHQLADPAKPSRKWPAALVTMVSVLREQAETVARAIAEATKMAAAAAVARITAGVPMTPVALTQTVTRASDEAALRLGLTVVTDAMNLGRSIVAGQRSYQIQRAVYSAILDASVCEECAGMDGRTTDDLDEAAGWTPNPECAGGAMCRCITIYTLDPDSQEAGA